MPSLLCLQVGAVGIEVLLSNITLKEFAFNSETIELQPPNRVVVAAPAMTIVATMNWRYHDGLIKISGNATDLMNQTSLNLPLELGSHDGRLTLSLPSTAVNIHDFKITLDKAAGSFYQDIVNLISSPLQSVFEKVISEALEAAINAIGSKVRLQEESRLQSPA